jgi:hypothetical protein
MAGPMVARRVEGVGPQPALPHDHGDIVPMSMDAASNTDSAIWAEGLPVSGSSRNSPVPVTRSGADGVGEDSVAVGASVAEAPRLGAGCAPPRDRSNAKSATTSPAAMMLTPRSVRWRVARLRSGGGGGPEGIAPDYSLMPPLPRAPASGWA